MSKKRKKVKKFNNRKSKIYSLKKYLNFFLVLSFIFFVIWILITAYENKENIYNYFNDKQSKVLSKTIGKTKNINIYGINKTNKFLIKKTINPYLEIPVLNIKLINIVDEIKKVPWVESVVVTRILPNTINIYIKEEVPFAIWKNSSKVVLISDMLNEIKGEDISKYKHLPLIIGFYSPQKSKDFLSLFDKYKNKLNKEIESFRLRGNRRWDINLVNGVTIKLPETGVEKSLKEMIFIVNKKGFPMDKLKSIDLRSNEKVTLEIKNNN